MEDIVETPWRKTVNWNNVFEECSKLKDEIEDYEPLGDLLTGEVSFPVVNILLFGEVGGGKSAVVNTLTSVFRERIFNIARSGSSPHVLTTKFTKYPLLSRGRNGPKPLKIRLHDMRGLEPEHLMTRDNMKYVLQGNIPDRFQLDPAGNISEDMPGFNKNPELHDRIHCVAFVQDASIDNENTLELNENIKDIQTVMNNLDVPQVVILTKVDSVSEEVYYDTAKIFNSTKVKTCVGKVSEFFGIPRNSIFPMKNYERETENDPCIDTIALLTLKGILNQCDAYLCNHYNTINESYRVAHRN